MEVLTGVEVSGMMLCSEVEDLELPDASFIWQWSHMQLLATACMTVENVKKESSDSHQHVRDAYKQSCNC